ncbi:MAG: CYTH domain-containing protein [Acidimicrobiaceae bacterium]|nr:CYTH domain-containing protein [Acidimicrobiaceae bacterium]MDE0495808.1 CYTH domain-containing protein [Acidimicrobiaceae bacterium]
MENVEVERKFLVPTLDGVWPSYHQPDARDGTPIVQGFLHKAKGRTVRIRLTSDHATLTLKGPREGSVRIEYEAEIDFDFGKELLALCEPNTVSKIRYPLISDHGFWAIDVFLDRNEGLIIAEAELEHPTSELRVPQWCGHEVTDDERFYNEYLAEHPYADWQ